MRVRPVTGQVQYQIPELLGPVLLGASLGSYTDPILATSLRPKLKSSSELASVVCTKDLGQNSTKGS